MDLVSTLSLKNAHDEMWNQFWKIDELLDNVIQQGTTETEREEEEIEEILVKYTTLLSNCCRDLERYMK